MDQNKVKRLVFSADHGGISLKDLLKNAAVQAEHEVLDLCPTTGESVDYPKVVQEAVRQFLASGSDFLILVCGSGVGVCMAANRHPEIRAVLTDQPYIARLARQHNQANCLCLGERVMGRDLAIDVLHTFITTQPDLAERHQNRVRQLGDLCPV